MNGMLAGAINIPAGDITKRLKDLPKDKEIITYCNTGLRAESAYEDLKAAGYKVMFLNALIQIDKDRITSYNVCYTKLLRYFID